MILGVVVAKVSDTRLPVDEELALACAIAYPIKCMSFLFDGAVCVGIGCIVVKLDWNGRM